MWRISRLNVLGELLAVKEGKELEEAFCQSLVLEGGGGAGTLCALISRFLKWGGKRVFPEGAMAPDLLSLEEIEALCARYESRCSKEKNL